MRRRWWVGLIVVGVPVGLVAPAPSAPSSPFGLPPTLADYRHWPKLDPSERPVPLDLWLRCSWPTGKDLEAERRRAGPHAEHLVRVYGNPAAASVVPDRPSVFPAGTTIAKEKLDGHGEPEAVAFMTKHSGAEFGDSGGWEFSYFPSAPRDKWPIQEHCAACHRTAARDYVFGEYPRAKPNADTR